MCSVNIRNLGVEILMQKAGGGEGDSDGPILLPRRDNSVAVSLPEAPVER